MIRCPACGALNRPDAPECVVCGVPLGGDLATLGRSARARPGAPGAEARRAAGEAAAPTPERRSPPTTEAQRARIDAGWGAPPSGGGWDSSAGAGERFETRFDLPRATVPEALPPVGTRVGAGAHPGDAPLGVSGSTQPGVGASGAPSAVLGRVPGGPDDTPVGLPGTREGALGRLGEVRPGDALRQGRGRVGRAPTPVGAAEASPAEAVRRTQLGRTPTLAPAGLAPVGQGPTGGGVPSVASPGAAAGAAGGALAGAPPRRDTGNVRADGPFDDLDLAGTLLASFDPRALGDAPGPTPAGALAGGPERARDPGAGAGGEAQAFDLSDFDPHEVAFDPRDPLDRAAESIASSSTLPRVGGTFQGRAMRTVPPDQQPPPLDSLAPGPMPVEPSFGPLPAPAGATLFGQALVPPLASVPTRPGPPAQAVPPRRADAVDGSLGLGGEGPGGARALAFAGPPVVTALPPRVLTPAPSAPERRSEGRARAPAGLPAQATEGVPDFATDSDAGTPFDHRTAPGLPPPARRQPGGEPAEPGGGQTRLGLPAVPPSVAPPAPSGTPSAPATAAATAAAPRSALAPAARGPAAGSSGGVPAAVAPDGPPAAAGNHTLFGQPAVPMPGVNLATAAITPRYSPPPAEAAGHRTLFGQSPAVLRSAAVEGRAEAEVRAEAATIELEPPAADLASPAPAPAEAPPALSGAQAPPEAPASPDPTASTDPAAATDAVGGQRPAPGIAPVVRPAVPARPELPEVHTPLLDERRRLRDKARGSSRAPNASDAYEIGEPPARTAGAARPEPEPGLGSVALARARANINAQERDVARRRLRLASLVLLAVLAGAGIAALLLAQDRSSFQVVLPDGGQKVVHRAGHFEVTARIEVSEPAEVTTPVDTQTITPELPEVRFSVPDAKLVVGRNELPLVVTAQASRETRIATLVVELYYRLHTGGEQPPLRPGVPVTVRVETVPGARLQVERATVAQIDGSTFEIRIDPGAVLARVDEATTDVVLHPLDLYVEPPGGPPQRYRELVPLALPRTPLTISAPPRLWRARGDSVRVAGTAAPGAAVRVDGRPVSVDGRGRFEAQVALPSPGKHAITVEADAVQRRPNRVRLEVERPEAEALAAIATQLRAEARPWLDAARAIKGANDLAGPEAPAVDTLVRLQAEVVSIGREAGVDVVVVAMCPKGDRCPVWIEVAGPLLVGPGAQVEVVGRLAGRRAYTTIKGDTLEVPRVVEATVLP